jgi:hypothetical protein
MNRQEKQRVIERQTFRLSSQALLRNGIPGHGCRQKRAASATSTRSFRRHVSPSTMRPFGMLHSKEILYWEFVLTGEVVQFNTAIDSKLVVDTSDVLLNSIFSDFEPIGDVFVGHSMQCNR